MRRHVALHSLPLAMAVLRPSCSRVPTPGGGPAPQRHLSGGSGWPRSWLWYRRAALCTASRPRPSPSSSQVSCTSATAPVPPAEQEQAGATSGQGVAHDLARELDEAERPALCSSWPRCASQAFSSESSLERLSALVVQLFGTITGATGMGAPLCQDRAWKWRGQRRGRWLPIHRSSRSGPHQSTTGRSKGS